MFFRTLLVGLALWASIASFVLWNEALNELLPKGHTVASIIVVGLALVLPVTMLAHFVQTLKRSEFTRQEVLAVRLLAYNVALPPLLVVVLAVLFPVTLGIEWNFAASESDSSDIAWSLLFVITATSTGVFVAVSFPAILLLHGLARRLKAPAPWRHHSTLPHHRFDALLGVSALTGGWTAAAGVASDIYIGSLIPTRQSGFEENVLVVLAAFPGAIAGLLLGLIVAGILQRTRLDRSAPITFSATFVAGAIFSVWTMSAGAGAAAIVGIATAWICRRRYFIHPIGHCQSCGYSLAGITAPRCPECGHSGESPPAPSPARAAESVTADDATQADR